MIDALERDTMLVHIKFLALYPLSTHTALLAEYYLILILDCTYASRFCRVEKDERSCKMLACL